LRFIELIGLVIVTHGQGVNLPMLIKLAEARETANLEDASVKAKEAGQRYIAIASKILSGET